MFIDPACQDFIHPAHFMFFVEAAKRFQCHILVRKTGRYSIRWMGKPGYTGKRIDMKAKTANAENHPLAGLVCSPWLRPEAFTAERLVEARKWWMKSRNVITEPPDGAGLDAGSHGRQFRTPYVVQTRRGDPRYGCLAFVESGLVRPRYIHGDYDLFAIVPAGKKFNAESAHLRANKMFMESIAMPGSLGLEEKLQRQPANFEGPLAFQVSTFLNVQIAAGSPDLLGALLVNHGEQINHRKATPDPGALYTADGRRTRPDILEPPEYEEVLAVMAHPDARGRQAVVLHDRAEHDALYRQARPRRTRNFNAGRR